MHTRSFRMLVVTMALLLPSMLASSLPGTARVQAQQSQLVAGSQVQQAGTTSHTARTRPRSSPRSVRSAAAAPAAGFPSTMRENFEGAWPSTGWALQNFSTNPGEYLFGKRTCTPQSGQFAGWAGGGGADGATLPCGSEYASDLYTIALYGPFDLSTAASSVLTYAYRGASEKDYDYLFVAASVDDYYYCGNTHTGPATAGYVQGKLDLSNLGCSGMPSSMLGQPQVWLAFFFVSDYSVGDTGYIVDNISLTSGQIVPTSTPTRTATATATGVPTETPTDTPTNTPTETPTNTPIGAPTDTPGVPTSTPTDTPTNTPTDVPTDTPTNTPTDVPTNTPTNPPTSTPSTALNLVVNRMELTQGVQTTTNSVPLIAGRPLVVRVNVGVQNSAEAILGVGGLLHGMRNGVELPNSPLRPFNNGGTIVAPLTPNRENFDHTLNFQVPGEWTTGGPLTLWAEVNPNRAVSENRFDDNRSADQVIAFRNVPTLQIVLVPVAYQPGGAGPVMRPDLSQNNQGLTNLQNLYPVANVQTTLHSEYFFTGNLNGNGWNQLLDDITAMRNRELGGAARTSKVVYYGVVPQASVAGQASFTAGLGWVGGNILASVGLEESFGVAAHEIGHNLGLGHAPCGVSGEPTYPFADGRIGDAGVDVYQRQLHPSGDKDFMSYCDPIWVSAHNYRRMLNVLAPATRAPAARVAIADGMIVSGKINPDAASGSLNYAIPLTQTETLLPGGTGEFRIEMRNAAGASLYSYAFDPAAVDSHTTNAGSGFSLVVPQVADLASIQIWNNDKLVMQQFASNVQPNLQASLTQTTDTLNVSWQASSPDNVPVRVTLRYSPDGGASWRVLALNQTGSNFTIAKRNLPSSTSGLLEVIANNTTQSRTVSLAIGGVQNKPPVVNISDTSNQQVYQGQPIVIQAQALDLEDGYLEGSSLVWTNARNQQVGAGETLTFPSGLALGTHVFTLTATDSAGAIARDTITITVSRPPPVSVQNLYQVFLPIGRR